MGQQEIKSKFLKAYINVHITRMTRKIRVEIHEAYEDSNDDVCYEVTVGGQEWRKGKGNKYKAEILKKVKRIMTEVEQHCKLLE